MRVMGRGAGSDVEVCVFPDTSYDFLYFVVVHGEFLKVVSQVGEVVMLAGGVGGGGSSGGLWFCG